MGLLDGLLGNASEIDPTKIEGNFAQVLASSERLYREGISADQGSVRIHQ